jgi:hypothetical protein
MAMDRDPNIYDRETPVVNRDTTVVDRESGSSNFLAFLIGGLVIAIGLLAFLFYDGGSSGGRDVSTTGSTTTRSAPATPGSGSMTAPAPAPSGAGSSTSAPATPTRP